MLQTRLCSVPFQVIYFQVKMVSVR